MAVLFDEPGSEQVPEVVYGPDRVMLPFVTHMEVEYKLLQLKPEIADEALATLDSWPVTTVESYYSWRRRAAAVKAEASLSFADAWVAALALINDATLVHKDPEFDEVAGLKHLRLLYSPRSQR
jgi:predicted nucleic acid-binding protein